MVLADWLFTTTTIVFQPLSGLYLAYLAGYPLNSAWIVGSVALYRRCLRWWTALGVPAFLALVVVFYLLWWPSRPGW